MKYTKTVTVEATQWFKNGDHPLDDVMRLFEDGTIPEVPREGVVVRYYRHPDVLSDGVCTQCGEKMRSHGWIDYKSEGHVVCPGDFVITVEDGDTYPCRQSIFESTYKRVEKEPDSVFVNTPESSYVVKFGYSGKRNVLIVVFKGGIKHEYFSVPRTVFEEMKKSESKWVFLSQCVEGKYRFEKVTISD